MERSLESTGTVRYTDGELLSRFEQQAIPRPEWTHRAHVMVAYLYVRDLDFEEALDQIRSGIKALNAANGVEEGPLMGYHETITVAFARIIAGVVAGHHPQRDLSAEEFCDKHPELMCSKLFRLFYSPQVLGSPRAKVSFLQPDIAQLPAIGQW
jgi:hypothetical protein